MPKIRHIPTGAYVGPEGTNDPIEIKFDRAGKVDHIVTPSDRATDYSLDVCYDVLNTKTANHNGREFEIIAPHGEWWAGKFLQA